MPWNPKAWRMITPCDDCPFSDSEAGKHQWKSLSPDFRRKLRKLLLNGYNSEYFVCHKTSRECGDGSHKVCAGALALQEKHGASSNYVRTCGRYFGG